MPEIMLGTAQFGQHYGISNYRGVPSYDELHRIKNTAKDLGVRALDTASSYGESEKVIGKVFDASWSITSKCSLRHGSAEPSVLLWAQVLKSLELLNVSSLDNVLLHDAKDVNLAWSVLRNLRDEGLVKKIGVSLYFSDDLEPIFALPDLDVVQIPLSIFDQRFLKSGVINRFKDRGVQIQIRSIFLQGLLLMEPQQRPSYFSNWAETFGLLDNYLRQEQILAKELCINFVSHLPCVDNVVIGVETAEQLTEIVEFARGDRSPIPIPEWLSCSDPRLLDPFSWKI